MALAPTPVVYRVLDDERPSPDEVAAQEFRYGARILYVNSDAPAPAEPTRVEGLVIHSTVAETKRFVGSENPILEHLEAFQRIENDKYFEAELIRSVAPRAFARTELVGTVWQRPEGLGDEAYLSLLERQMHERYPRGFVLKPLSSFSTDGRFPSERTSFVPLWKAFHATARPMHAGLEAEGVHPTHIHLKLKLEPSYPGRILDALLSAPDTVIIQERLPIAEVDGVPDEYRVHVIGGRVLQGATQHRWNIRRVLRAERIRTIEAFVQGIVRGLPHPYDRLTYGVDVVALRDGSLAFMEGNAGWESQYFYASTDLWVANLMAERYLGAPTPFLRQFRGFETTRGLAAKIDALRRLLDLAPLRPAVAEKEPMTEVLSRARTVLLAEFRKAPSRRQLAVLQRAIAELELDPYLTYDEIDELAERERGITRRAA